jgi:Cu+-exporting ATPase
MLRKSCLLILVALLAFGWSSLATAQASKLYDPVCGMEVGKDAPHAAEYEGGKYYFCSAGCKTQFSKEPVKYACFCLSGSDCLHCMGKVANCPCEKMKHDHAHCHGQHKGGQ